jgi:hypothetical protein
VADHDGVLDAEPVQCLADPASLVRSLVAAVGRLRRPAVPEQGERLAPDEVRRQWDRVVSEASSRWQTLREAITRRRRRSERSRAS